MYICRSGNGLSPSLALRTCFSAFQVSIHYPIYTYIHIYTCICTSIGGDSWPSGVLICGENWVSYKHQSHIEIRTALPRRHDLPPERGVLITAGTVHKQKDLFFLLLQSEYGDLYKVSNFMSNKT